MYLYEISDQFKELEKLEDIDQETLNDTLESLTAEFQDKGVSVASYFLNLDSDIAQLKKAEKRIAIRRKLIEKKSDSLKLYLTSNMQRLEISKIECPEFSISLRKSLSVLIVEDQSLIPDEFITIKTTVSVDKNEIKRRIKNGETVDGVYLKDGKQSLIIK